MSGARRLTSRANPGLKAAARLRNRRERDRQGLTLIDGAREVARAIAGRTRLREAFLAPEDCADAECQATLAELDAIGVPVQEVSSEAFARLAYGDRADGLIVVAETPPHGLADLGPRLPTQPLIAVIEGVEKPGNVGAILRSADGAGFSAVVLAEPGTDLFNPNVIRASLGTVFAVPVAVTSSEEILGWLTERSIRIVAARVEGSIDYAEADYRGPLAIALGSEAHGLSDAWAAAADTAVRLPMLGVADSLNVSATAAVLFYEALRQRRVGRVP
ncbi:MAG TPA: RNA methyltransferase [Candidatus Limnocylindrales bacterium]|nr:RNA methyltransferase [Candidatus Limnocylindrales bacterium]